ncbi:MAG: diaminopimelate decarboxylase [Firmicutes bacterium]|nr:diaminopimelate decarboxylase [Bacillota bacterium]
MHLYGTQAIDAEGHLTIGGVRAVDLARRFGTPLYVLDEELIRQNCRAYVDAFRSAWPDFIVAYAAKAFLCTAMAALVHQEGLYLDVVSGGELITALRAGVPAERLIFHGNNKTPEELDLALRAGVGRIVVDSFSELDLLADMAAEREVRPRIALRITPGVEAHTHHYIATGQLDSKFGIPIAGGAGLEAVRRALETPAVDLVGLHCHIGSQILDLGGYEVTAARMVDFMAAVQRETGWTCPELNLGGGLGVRYTAEDRAPTPAELVAVLTRTVRARCEAHELPLPRLVVEPGRSIVGEAGTTLYTVGAIKEIPGVRTYVAVDGGMGDNPRPALYQARYDAVVANRAAEPRIRLVTVVGRTCESGDVLIRDLPVPETIARGDILAVQVTGAYNYSMASHYNRFPKPAVVLVRDGEADVVVERETWEDLLRFDRMPERLRAGVAWR